MAARGFTLTERHADEYHTLGYTVFESIVPPPLISGLRQACEELRCEARRQAGPQAQRLTKIIGTGVDAGPFKAYSELPDVRMALEALLGPGTRHGTHMFWTEEQTDYHAGHGVLIEPAERPYCTNWHRDWRDNVHGLSLDEWDKVCTNRRLFNQINLALYQDSCLWVVPGSHLRRDTPAEAALFPDRPIPRHPTQASVEEVPGSVRPAAEVEAEALAYARSMPGATQLHLNAGDLCVYRSAPSEVGI